MPEERTDENFQKLMKAVKTQIEKAPEFPSQTNKWKVTNFRVKLKKITSAQKKIIKVGQKKKMITFQEEQ